MFSKISDKLMSISSCVIFQLFQEAMVSLKKVFLDPIGKMMPGATILLTRQEGGFK